MKIHPLIKKIETAGLLGRGCGTFPVAQKWQAVLSARDQEKYVIANCSESEPGIFKDEFILDRYPERVIDGILLAMKTVGAKQGIIYLSPTYYRRYKNKLHLLIGRSPIELFAKPHADYIGGEETAALNLMEGKREESRLRPPYITAVGFHGHPTLVNNCETFYNVSLINDNKYRAERFFCISGDDIPRNIYSFPETLTVKQALLKSGHYPRFPFFIQLGGAMAGNCLRENQLDIPLHHYSGLIIHRLDTDERKLFNSWLSFFARESCGKCVPCREGAFRLLEMFKSRALGTEAFWDIINTMQNTTICSLGKMATTAISSYLINIKRIKKLES